MSRIIVRPVPSASPRAKTGGRRKGTPNKTTAALRDAILQVFADLQVETDGEYGHFLDWARDHSTDFYKLASRLLPRQLLVPEERPAITEVRRIIIPARPRPEPEPRES